MKQTNPWQFHAPSDSQKARMQVLRDAFEQLASLVERMAPHCRERSLAITKLEEAATWSNKAVNQSDD